MTKTTTWHFECGCRKRISIDVEDTGDIDKTREVAAEIARVHHGWRSIRPTDHILSCSTACWNSYHEAIFNKRTTFYPKWWETSPYGRKKHDCESPPCHCKPKLYEVFTRDEHGRGRTVKLLDGFHHDDNCWWGSPGLAKEKPRPIY